MRLTFERPTRFDIGINLRIAVLMTLKGCSYYKCGTSANCRPQLRTSGEFLLQLIGFRISNELNDCSFGADATDLKKIATLCKAK